jgi:anti-anti-sigma regulatory factor
VARADRGAGGAFTLVLESSAPVAVLRLTGLLDLAAAVELRSAMNKVLTGQPSAIVVDLAGLAVGDDIVLTVFPAVARSAAGWGDCPVLLCAPSTALASDLERMAVDRAVPVYGSREQALTAAAAVAAPRRIWRRLADPDTATADARELVVNACQAWHLPDMVDDAELVATELVSNAMRHAGPGVELLLVLRERFLHLSVRDGSPQPPRRSLPDPDTGEGGRGLLLVDALTAGWGSTPMPSGKVVWATLRLPR